METYDHEEEEFTAQFNSGTLRRIIMQTRPHWRYVVGFLVLTAVVSFFDAYFTYLGKRVVDEGILAHNPAALTHILVLWGAFTVVQAGAVLGLIYLANVLGEQVQYDLRKRMFEHLQELSFSYYSRTPVGWMMTRVTSDSERIAQLVTWGMIDSSWGVLNVITSLVFMLAINWKLALLVIAIVPALLIVAIQFKTRILLQYRKVRRINSKITAAYNENITGVRVVKALCREEENLNEFGELAGDMYHNAYRAAWLSALFLPVVQLIAAFAVGTVAYYAGRTLLGAAPATVIAPVAGALTIGGIQAFVGYVTNMMWPIQDLARVYAEMQHAIASAERIFSLIDAQPEVVDRPGAVDPGTITGEIEFDHVDFSYQAGDPVLCDFSLRVKPGETIALVGPTGGGKSTIVNLLCRFYEPTGGQIRISGRDYTTLTLDAIQKRIGVVLQTPHLFSGTVSDNLRYGRLAATDEEIETAARLAGAHDFITTLKDGYATDVGEGGNLLSVGQKQLISLARAVLAQPEIFIMDEATSSVDTLTEALIQRGMESLMRGRTSFVIAHRLSTIRRADRILVIEDGTIREMGTHAELLRRRGHYYRLYTQQFRHEIEKGMVAGDVSAAAA